jgi:hypothetical protein
MEDIIKELQGKDMTKKMLFDFLANMSKKECEACMKKVSNIESLEKHYEKNPACAKWKSLTLLPNASLPNTSFKKGIHLIINELLDKSIHINGKLECKFCNKTFVNTGNLHKHFNNATVCNRLAYIEFKELFNSI